MSAQPEVITDLPTWLPAEAWQGYLDMRKEIKKSPTARAITLLQKKLLKFHQAGQDIEAVLDQSTMNNWTDVYPVKQDKLSIAQGMSASLAASVNSLQNYLRDNNEI